MNDPTVIETDHLRKRIAELEQVVRELRQRNPARQSNAAAQASATALPMPVSIPAESDDKGQDSKKRRVIVDRFARFKIDEAAMAAVANAAAAGQDNADDSVTGGDSRRSSGGLELGAQMDAGRGKKDYRAEPYTTYLLPGEEMVYDRIGRKTFLGAAAGKSMLRRVSRRRSGRILIAAARTYEYWAAFHDRRRIGSVERAGRRRLHWSLSRHAKDVSVYDDLVARKLFGRDYRLVTQQRAV